MSWMWIGLLNSATSCWVPRKSLHRNGGWCKTDSHRGANQPEAEEMLLLRIPAGLMFGVFGDLAGIPPHLQDSRVHEDTDLWKGQILNKQQSEESTRNSLFLKFQVGQIRPCKQQCHAQSCLVVAAGLNWIQAVPGRLIQFVPYAPKLLIFFQLLV